MGRAFATECAYADTYRHIPRGATGLGNLIGAGVVCTATVRTTPVPGSTRAHVLIVE